MKNNIIFREFKKEDKPYLVDIIRKTWQYDLFCSSKTAYRLAKLYLEGCLGSQTFTRVALIDNVPMGIIMGRDIKNHKTSLKSLFSQGLGVATLFLSSEGRKVGKVFGGIQNIDKELLGERGENYEGEVAFFALNECCRGLGIGKKLFISLKEYFKDCNINKFYLYTDTSCNYGFYEHEGLRRCGERIVNVPIGIKNEMTFYLYEGEVELK